MKLGIDIDGVIARFTPEGIRDIVRDVTGVVIPEGYEPPDWDHSDILTKDDWKAIMEKVVATEEFWLTLPAFDDNVAALREFCDAHTDAEIYFVTARTPTITPCSLLCDTARWLDRQDLGGLHKTVIPVEHGRDKWMIYKAIGIEWTLDDHKRNQIAAQKNHPEGHHYILNKRYNQVEHPYRVNTMEEFLKAVTHGERN